MEEYFGLLTIALMMSKLLATKTSQRVGDKWGYLILYCTPVESEDDSGSCNFISLFCDYNFLCLTNTVLFQIVNYVFHGSKLKFAAPDDTLDGIQCSMGGYFNWNID